jgi:hypothetical protein
MKPEHCRNSKKHHYRSRTTLRRRQVVAEAKAGFEVQSQASTHIGGLKTQTLRAINQIERTGKSPTTTIAIIAKLQPPARAKGGENHEHLTQVGSDISLGEARSVGKIKGHGEGAQGIKCKCADAWVVGKGESPGPDDGALYARGRIVVELEVEADRGRPESERQAYCEEEANAFHINIGLTKRPSAECEG